MVPVDVLNVTISQQPFPCSLAPFLGLIQGCPLLTPHHPVPPTSSARTIWPHSQGKPIAKASPPGHLLLTASPGRHQSHGSVPTSWMPIILPGYGLPEVSNSLGSKSWPAPYVTQLDFTHLKHGQPSFPSPSVYLPVCLHISSFQPTA